MRGTLVRIPGLIVCRQRPGTAKGITFLLLEDEFDLINIVVHPWLYEQQRHHVRATPLLVVHGRLQHAKNNINVSFQAERFRNWASSKDVRYRDWDAAFRNWLLKAEPSKTTTTSALWEVRS